MPLSSLLKTCLQSHRNKVSPCLSFQYTGKKQFFISGICSSPSLSLSLSDFLFSLTADKINNLTGAGSAACWIVLCFCCDFEAWKQIKERLIWSRQEYFYTNTVSIRLGACWINCFFLCHVNFSYSLTYQFCKLYRNSPDIFGNT